MLAQFNDAFFDIFSIQCIFNGVLNMRNILQYTIDVNTTSLLMLQFGFLVFILSLVALAVPNYFGLYGSFLLTAIPLLISLFYALITLHYVYTNNTVLFISGFKWFSLPGTVQVNFDLLIDKLTITYVSLVLSIGVAVVIYTFSYFRYEPHVERLLLFINLFMISMSVLVLGANLFVLFLGWELIGLTSFFLINFWSTRVSTLKAAFKAFLFNKVSDLGVLIFILITMTVTGESNILIINTVITNFKDYKLSVIGLTFSYTEVSVFFLMIAAFVKSAQFGFHVWLPDSMEAPVPASALIHSATLVSAGVFLFLRFAPLLEVSSVLIYWILLTSSFTAALGGVSACFQSDAKRILAYSTISHCGFLIFLACTATLEITLFYLCVHGFFKALVFLCIGNVIRFARNYQDFRYMGGFAKFLPFETCMTLVGLINLSGLPFSFGFFIKHLTLLSLFDTAGWFIKINIFVGMVTGLVYSYRLYYYIFFDTKKAKKAVYFGASSSRLQSRHYSNSTLASNISITLLFIVAVIMLVYIYSHFFILESHYGRDAIGSVNNKTYFILNSGVENSNLIGIYVNWVVLIVISVLVMLKFRYQSNIHVLVQNTSFLLMLMFFSFFCATIILNMI